MIVGKLEQILGYNLFSVLGIGSTRFQASPVQDLGKVRKWLEASNKLGKTVGIRWLRRKTILVEEGKKTSSVVVYLEKPIEVGKVRLGGRWLKADQYERDRGRK
ncbi:hypothetical protein BDZ91DRAFT_763872 [Kalaharituber pfeilii]|nr:hypothetical protein BDZ91DRAFT_763872 [Kalaharituber pfeilii]